MKYIFSIIYIIACLAFIVSLGLGLFYALNDMPYETFREAMKGGIAFIAIHLIDLRGQESDDEN